MKSKRVIKIRLGDQMIDVEVDALDYSDMPATIDACMDSPANFRAIELAAKFGDDRVKGMPTAVYVICAEDVSICKIGCGSNPASRLIGIQIGNWHKLNIAALLWTDNGAYEVEQLALKAAKEMGIHVRGEWVSASPREAIELVLKAAKYSTRPAYDSATWLDNWAHRLDAVAEAKDRGASIGRLKPRGGK